ncbi:hypothetical protein FQN60_016144 [Etheostoma spectabile]|uniref:Cohesin loading complex subunit SCC4 homolog n=1 Tax=Etheostoma spectabile TaxID=54343 RepID=A0A5J5CY68_9PERO|nr:hypothetical protein FQN60_016144 [Etheostoma spectabile]
MAASTETPEPRCLALLGFAEHFRTSSPPKNRLCVHCLQAVFQYRPPPVKARTHLRSRPGHTSSYARFENSEGARTHLEKANLVDAKPVLRKMVQISQQSPYLHCRLLFQLAKVTGMHSMHAGYLEKAQKYTDKSQMQLEKLKSKFTGIRSLLISPFNDNSTLIHPYMSKVLDSRSFCPRSRSSCWRTSSCAGWSPDTRPQLYNRCVICSSSSSKMPNAEDLNRLTACSLVLLGHIFFVLGNHRESSDMVDRAMQLASEIPDLSVQLWSSARLKDLNKACRNAMAAHEAAQMHQNLSKQLQQGHVAARSLPEHQLILLDRRPPPCAVSASEWPCYQPGQAEIKTPP